MLTKPKQIAHFVTFTGHFCTFRLWYGGRAALSVKGAQQFWSSQNRGTVLQNSCTSPWDRPLTACALLSLFSGCRKVQKYTEKVSLCCGFVSVPFGNCRETVRLPCLLFPAVKVYNGSKNFWRKTTSENSSNLRPLLLRCADGAIH